MGLLFSQHKGDHTNNNSFYSPKWVPGFGMEAAKGSANWFICLKAALWCKKHDLRGLHWILCWKSNFAMVVATFVITVFKSENQKVPVKNIIFIWNSDKII